MSKTSSINIPQEQQRTSKYTCKMMVQTEPFEGLEEILAEASNLSVNNTATVGGENITIPSLLCFQQSNATVLRCNLTGALLFNCAMTASWIKTFALVLALFKTREKNQCSF